MGYFLFLLGVALNDWSLWCLAALIVIATNLHLLVPVEEEHLLRTFGEQHAVLNLVPLAGSPREMPDMNLETRHIRQSLEFRLPEALETSWKNVAAGDRTKLATRIGTSRRSPGSAGETLPEKEPRPDKRDIL